MPRMRGIDPRVSALILVVEKPFERKGYDDLLLSYESMGMQDEADCVRFLIAERFDADGSNTDGQ
jgi:hypothetical protein